MKRGLKYKKWTNCSIICSPRRNNEVRRLHKGVFCSKQTKEALGVKVGTLNKTGQDAVGN